MLSRLLPKSSHLRLLSNLYSNSPPIPLPLRVYHPIFILRSLSTSNGNGNGNGGGDKSASDVWRLSGESDGRFDSFFAPDSKDGLAGFSDPPAADERSWEEEDAGGGIFGGGEKEYEARATAHRDDDWVKSDGEKMWTLDGTGEDKSSDVFGIGDFGVSSNVIDGSEQQDLLEQEEKVLTAVLKGPNRAFGDLIAASGITDAMLDSLFALKDFEGVEGLPPLSEIEDMRYEKTTRKSSRFEMERQKQEEVAKARVRQVDDKGRAYGTGRRKCSVARVWIQPGEGQFKINDKEFDVYFPMLDHRAALLRPFSETKTLGLWDINCTVKGGGLSGQVGAIQLGISRALQNWEPDLRPPLRDCGFLTRDPRVVERKKPGKAKARKSFQWVKR